MFTKTHDGHSFGGHGHERTHAPLVRRTVVLGSPRTGGQKRATPFVPTSALQALLGRSVGRPAGWLHDVKFLLWQPSHGRAQGNRWCHERAWILRGVCRVGPRARERRSVRIVSPVQRLGRSIGVRGAVSRGRVCAAGHAEGDCWASSAGVRESATRSFGH